MKRNDHRVRIGITLTILGGLLFLFVFSLDSCLSLWRGTRTVSVTFRAVQGLRRDDPVHFHGVPCGKVADIRFVGTSAAPAPGVAYAASVERRRDVEIELDLEVPAEVFGYLRQSSQATIEKTLTGVTVVQLQQGSGAPLEPGQALEGTELVTLQTVTESMQKTVVETNAVLGAVRAIVESAQERDLVSGVLHSLKESVDQARDFAGLLRDLVEENRESVGRLVTEGADLAQSLQVAAEHLPGAVGQGEEALAQVSALAADATDWFHGARPHLTKTSEELAKTAGNFNKLARDLRRRPWRLLNSPDEGEMEKLDLYQCVEEYANGAVELHRGLVEVRALLAAECPDERTQRRLEETLSELEQRLDRQQEFEKTFWDRLQQVAPD